MKPQHNYPLNTDPARGYLGNCFIKRDGINQQFTVDEILEYQKCMADPGYFAETYVKVINLNKGLVPFRLYPYQRKMFKHFRENRFSIVLACRQSGKCAAIDTIIDVKHKHTGKTETITIGDFHARLSSKTNYSGIYCEGETPTPPMEYSYREDNKSIRQHFSTLYPQAVCAETRKTCRGNQTLIRVSGRDNLPDLWSLPTQGYTTTSDNSPWSATEGVLESYFSQLNSTEILSKNAWREEPLAQPWREDESFFKKVITNRGGEISINCQGLSEPGLQHSSVLLAEEDRLGPAEGEGLTSQETIGVFSRLVHQKVRGGSWDKEVPGEARQMAGETPREATRGDAKNQPVEIFRNDEFPVQPKAGSQRNSGTSLCSEAHEYGVFTSILESWDNIEDPHSEAVGAGHHPEGNAPARGSDNPIYVLRGIQDGTRNFEDKQRHQNEPRYPSDNDNRGIHDGTKSKLSDGIERKFIEEFDASDYQVWSDSGWVDIDSSKKTIEYEEWEVTLDNGQVLTVADTHIFFTNNLEEVFAKDCLNANLYAKDGVRRVISVVKNGKSSHMYDLGVDSPDHRYFGDGILSHNSISSVIYLLWYAIFHPEKTIVILANKGATSREMLSRVTLALENLPFFLQPGCKSANKGSIIFSNNSTILAAGTSSNSIRGLSVNLLFLDEFAFVHNAAEFYTSTYPVISSGESTQVIITSTANGVGNLFYRLWEGAVQQANLYRHMRVDWWDVPGRDQKWKEETIANTSPLQFDQEFGNCLSILSEVAIRINKTYECLIRIGDLYLAGRRANSSGLSLEEEIRLLALRWNHIEEEVQIPDGGTSEVLEVQ